MNLDDFIEQLECAHPKNDPEGKLSRSSNICNGILEMLQYFLKQDGQTFLDKISAVQAVLDLYTLLRPKYDAADERAESLGQYLFVESARLVLGVEFSQLADDNTQKADFVAMTSVAYTKLMEFEAGSKFLVLKWLMINQWTHPTLVSLMKGDDMDEERAMTYLRSGEYPELFKLRIEMLAESGCESFALNLTEWCLKCPLFQGDQTLVQTKLVLLSKLGKRDDIVNMCLKIPCCEAVALMKKTSEANKTSEQGAFLMMAQTFLLQDWMSPTYCCTKKLLHYFFMAERRGEPEDPKFIANIEKILQLSPDTKQMMIFLEVMIAQFGDKFLEFCSEISLRIIRQERHALDTARIYRKDAEEAAKAADRLARACSLIAAVYAKHAQMSMSALLTALYLDPKDTFYNMSEDIVTKLTEPFSSEPKGPDSVEENVYSELLEMVDFMRPASFHLVKTKELSWELIKSGWEALKKVAINHLQEAGYKYHPQTNTFTLVTKQKEKKEKKHKKSKEDRKKSKEAKAATPQRATEARGSVDTANDSVDSVIASVVNMAVKDSTPTAPKAVNESAPKAVNVCAPKAVNVSTPKAEPLPTSSESASGSPRRVFECDLCGTCFTTMFSKNRHKNSVHGIKVEPAKDKKKLARDMDDVINCVVNQEDTSAAEIMQLIEREQNFAVIEHHESYSEAINNVVNDCLKQSAAELELSAVCLTTPSAVSSASCTTTTTDRPSTTSHLEESLQALTMTSQAASVTSSASSTGSVETKLTEEEIRSIFGDKYYEDLVAKSKQFVGELVRPLSPVALVLDGKKSKPKSPRRPSHPKSVPVSGSSTVTVASTKSASTQLTTMTPNNSNSSISTWQGDPSVGQKVPPDIQGMVYDTGQFSTLAGSTCVHGSDASSSGLSFSAGRILPPVNGPAKPPASVGLFGEPRPRPTPSITISPRAKVLAPENMRSTSPGAAFNRSGLQDVTLDEVQQVLSSSQGGVTNSSTTVPVDEDALREITDFLQDGVPGSAAVSSGSKSHVPSGRSQVPSGIVHHYAGNVPDTSVAELASQSPSSKGTSLQNATATNSKLPVAQGKSPKSKKKSTLSGTKPTPGVVKTSQPVGVAKEGSPAKTKAPSKPAVKKKLKAKTTTSGGLPTVQNMIQQQKAQNPAEQQMNQAMVVQTATEQEVQIQLPSGQFMTVPARLAQIVRDVPGQVIQLPSGEVWHVPEGQSLHLPDGRIITAASGQAVNIAPNIVVQQPPPVAQAVIHTGPTLSQCVQTLPAAGQTQTPVPDVLANPTVQVATVSNFTLSNGQTIPVVSTGLAATNQPIIQDNSLVPVGPFSAQNLQNLQLPLGAQLMQMQNNQIVQMSIVNTAQNMVEILSPALTQNFSAPIGGQVVPVSVQVAQMNAQFPNVSTELVSASNQLPISSHMISVSNQLPFINQTVPVTSYQSHITNQMVSLSSQLPVNNQLVSANNQLPVTSQRMSASIQPLTYNQTVTVSNQLPFNSENQQAKSTPNISSGSEHFPVGQPNVEKSESMAGQPPSAITSQTLVDSIASKALQYFTSSTGPQLDNQMLSTLPQCRVSSTSVTCSARASTQVDDVLKASSQGHVGANGSIVSQTVEEPQNNLPGPEQITQSLVDEASDHLPEEAVLTDNTSPGYEEEVLPALEEISLQVEVVETTAAEPPASQASDARESQTDGLGDGKCPADDTQFTTKSPHNDKEDNILEEQLNINRKNNPISEPGQTNKAQQAAETLESEMGASKDNSFSCQEELPEGLNHILTELISSQMSKDPNMLQYNPELSVTHLEDAAQTPDTPTFPSLKDVEETPTPKEPINTDQVCEGINGKLENPQQSATPLQAFSAGVKSSVDKVGKSGEFTSGESVTQKENKMLDESAVSSSSSGSEDDADTSTDNSHFKCKFCDKSFDMIAARRQHQEWFCEKKPNTNELPPEEYEVFGCEVCGKEMETDRGVKIHMQRVHGVSTRSAENSFECTVCGKMLSSKFNLMNHFRKQHPEEAEYSSKQGGDRLMVLSSDDFTAESASSTVMEEEGSELDTSEMDTASPHPQKIPNGLSMKGCSVKLDRLSTEAIVEATSPARSRPTTPRARGNAHPRALFVSLSQDSSEQLSSESSERRRSVESGRSKSPGRSRSARNIRQRRSSQRVSNTDSDSEDDTTCACANCGGKFHSLTALRIHLEQNKCKSYSGSTSEYEYDSQKEKSKDKRMGSSSDTKSYTDTDSITKQANNVNTDIKEKVKYYAEYVKKESKAFKLTPPVVKPAAPKPIASQAEMTFPKTEVMCSGVVLHESKIYKCVNCLMKFPSMELWSKHRDSTTHKQPYLFLKNYFCIHCKKSFGLQIACATHSKQCEKGPNANAVIQTPNSSNNNMILDLLSPQKCPGCSKTFLSKDTLEKHQMCNKTCAEARGLVPTKKQLPTVNDSANEQFPAWKSSKDNKMSSGFDISVKTTSIGSVKTESASFGSPKTAMESPISTDSLASANFRKFASTLSDIDSSHSSPEIGVLKKNTEKSYGYDSPASESLNKLAEALAKYTKLKNRPEINTSTGPESGNSATKCTETNKSSVVPEESDQGKAEYTVESSNIQPAENFTIQDNSFKGSLPSGPQQDSTEADLLKLAPTSETTKHQPEDEISPKSSETVRDTYTCENKDSENHRNVVQDRSVAVEQVEDEETGLEDEIKEDDLVGEKTTREDLVDEAKDDSPDDDLTGSTNKDSADTTLVSQDDEDLDKSTESLNDSMTVELALMESGQEAMLSESDEFIALGSDVNTEMEQGKTVGEETKCVSKEVKNVTDILEESKEIAGEVQVSTKNNPEDENSLQSENQSAPIHQSGSPHSEMAGPQTSGTAGSSASNTSGSPPCEMASGTLPRETTGSPPTATTDEKLTVGPWKKPKISAMSGVEDQQEQTRKNGGATSGNAIVGKASVEERVVGNNKELHGTILVENERQEVSADRTTGNETTETIEREESREDKQPASLDSQNISDSPIPEYLEVPSVNDTDNTFDKGNETAEKESGEETKVEVKGPINSEVQFTPLDFDVCYMCDREVQANSSDAEEHGRGVCGENFLRKRIIRIQCTLCKVLFPTIMLCEAHRYSCHGEPKTPTKVTTLVKSPKSPVVISPNKESSSSCPKCTKKFLNSEAVASHLVKAHGLSKKKANKLLRETDNPKGKKKTPKEKEKSTKKKKTLEEKEKLTEKEKTSKEKEKQAEKEKTSKGPEKSKGKRKVSKDTEKLNEKEKSSKESDKSKEKEKSSEETDKSKGKRKEKKKANMLDPAVKELKLVVDIKQEEMGAGGDPACLGKENETDNLTEYVKLKEEDIKQASPLPNDSPEGKPVGSEFPHDSVGNQGATSSVVVGPPVDDQSNSSIDSETKKTIERPNSASKWNHVCPQCDLPFANQKLLSNHREKFCSPRTPPAGEIPCSECPEKFTSRQSFKSHKARVHRKDSKSPADSPKPDMLKLDKEKGNGWPKASSELEPVAKKLLKAENRSNSPTPSFNLRTRNIVVNRPDCQAPSTIIKLVQQPDIKAGKYLMKIKTNEAGEQVTEICAIDAEDCKPILLPGTIISGSDQLKNIHDTSLAKSSGSSLVISLKPAGSTSSSPHQSPRSKLSTSTPTTPQTSPRSSGKLSGSNTPLGSPQVSPASSRSITPQISPKGSVQTPKPGGKMDRLPLAQRRLADLPVPEVIHNKGRTRRQSMESDVSSQLSNLSGDHDRSLSPGSNKAQPVMSSSGRTRHRLVEGRQTRSMGPVKEASKLQSKKVVVSSTRTLAKVCSKTPKEKTANKAHVQEKSSVKEEITPEISQPLQARKSSGPEQDLSPNRLVAHKDSENKFACPYCDASFAKEYSLQSHLEWVHGLDHDQKHLHGCPLCKDNQIFETEAMLKCHMKWRHDIENYSPQGPIVSPTDDTEKKDMCAIKEIHCACGELIELSQAPMSLECQTSANEPQAMVEIKPDPDGFRISATPQFPSFIQGKGQTTSVDKKPDMQVLKAKTECRRCTAQKVIWRCLKCSSFFTQRVHLTTHLRICPGIDNSSSPLKNRLLTSDSIWRCSHCERKFTTMRDLNTHIASQHGKTLGSKGGLFEDMPERMKGCSDPKLVKQDAINRLVGPSPAPVPKPLHATNPPPVSRVIGPACSKEDSSSDDNISWCSRDPTDKWQKCKQYSRKRNRNSKQDSAKDTGLRPAKAACLEVVEEIDIETHLEADNAFASKPNSIHCTASADFDRIIQASKNSSNKDVNVVTEKDTDTCAKKCTDNDEDNKLRSEDVTITEIVVEEISETSDGNAGVKEISSGEEEEPCTADQPEESCVESVPEESKKPVKESVVISVKDVEDIDVSKAETQETTNSGDSDSSNAPMKSNNKMKKAQAAISGVVIPRKHSSKADATVPETDTFEPRHSPKMIRTRSRDGAKEVDQNRDSQASDGSISPLPRETRSVSKEKVECLPHEIITISSRESSPASVTSSQTSCRRSTRRSVECDRTRNVVSQRDKRSLSKDSQKTGSDNKKLKSRERSLSKTSTQSKPAGSPAEESKKRESSAESGAARKRHPSSVLGEIAVTPGSRASTRLEAAKSKLCTRNTSRLISQKVHQWKKWTGYPQHAKLSTDPARLKITPERKSSRIIKAAAIGKTSSLQSRKR